MICPKCGFTNVDDARFCGNCGEQIAPSFDKSSSDQAQTDQPVESFVASPPNTSGPGPQDSSTSQDQHRRSMNNKDKMIVVGAVVLMIVLLIATVAVIGAANNNANNSTNNVITLNGFRLDINYDGTSSGYFGPTIQNQTMNFDVRPGEEFTERATLTNNATSLSHSVIGIKVSSPFALDSITPSISSPISPEGSMTYTLVITAPSTGGDHVLSIVVTTT